MMIFCLSGCDLNSYRIRKIEGEIQNAEKRAEKLSFKLQYVTAQDLSERKRDLDNLQKLIEGDPAIARGHKSKAESWASSIAKTESEIIELASLRIRIKELQDELQEISEEPKELPGAKPQ